jgi:indoleamine 2,3-dioxygenase
MSYLQDDPPLPPLGTIFPHLETEPHSLPARLDPFTVTTKTGFMPSTTPLNNLPEQFAVLNDILEDMPVVREDGRPGLLASFGLGPLIDGGALPDLTDAIDPLIGPSGKEDMSLVTALFRDYSFLASAYLLEPCWQSWCKDHNKGYGLGRAILPHCIAGPLVKTATM